MFNPCAGCHGNVTQQVRFGSTVAYAMKFAQKIFVVLEYLEQRMPNFGKLLYLSLSEGRVAVPGCGVLC